MEDFRGLVRAAPRRGDELRLIAGGGCPYTLPIGGRSLIGYALRALRDAGASEILVAAHASIAEDIRIAIEDPGVPVHLAVVDSADDDAVNRAVEKVLGPGPLREQFADSLPGDVWRYDGTVDGVLEANTIALDGIKRGRVGVDLSNASVQGRVNIDPSAELQGAKIRGPVYIGPGARVIETYVGPYSTIGAGVCLEGVEIENSIVLREAQIRFPGRRIEGSLVGAGAQIGRDYSLPSALRLRVGPGSDIQLS